MYNNGDRFCSFLVMERGRHAKRAQFAGFIAVLIAILLYQTQWTSLRLGLEILLAGQMGVAIALVIRSARLSNDLRQRKMGDFPEKSLAGWFEGEELFLKRLAFFESTCQVIGFVVLGYEVWESTRSLWLALAIGLVYPASAYFGMTRGKNREALRRLKSASREFGH